jgi:hypothetical protein
MNTAEMEEGLYHSTLISIQIFFFSTKKLQINILILDFFLLWTKL